MTSLLRYAAVAALVSLGMGTAIEDVIPTKTAETSGGYGMPISEPTQGPSLELVKMRFEKRSVTNICTEWTIPGGFGQPECFNSETCLFTTASDGNYYEGCGQTSVRYDWITDCFNYPQSQTGTVPVSQIWCDAAAPYCGYFAFVFGVGYTFYNFGCSTVPYTLFVDLLQTSSTPTLIGNSGQTVTVTAIPTYVPQSSSANSQTTTSSPAASGTNPVITPHVSKTPIGAIVGGVIGGIALIAFLVFLFWFYRHKKSQNKTNVMQQQQQALDASAYNNPNRISEIGGVMLNKPPQAPFSQSPQHQQVAGNYFPEKPVAGMNTQELYRPAEQQPSQQPPQTAYMESSTSPVSGIPSPGSPPPTYTQPHSPTQIQIQPQQQSPPPPQNTFIPPQQGYNELENQQAPQRTSYIPYSAPAPAAATNELPAQTEVGQRESWVPPPAGNAQEMSGGSAATGGISRRPIQGQQGQEGFDMSGAAMSEEFHGHELP